MYWLDNIVKPNSAPLTYATYETYIRIYLLPHLGRIKLDRLSAAMCRPGSTRSLASASAARKARTRSVRTASADAALSEGAAASSSPVARSADIRPRYGPFSHTLSRKNCSRRNVAAGVRMPKVRKPKHKAWSSDEARASSNPRVTTRTPVRRLRLVLVAGLRKGEALGVTWTTSTSTRLNSASAPTPAGSAAPAASRDQNRRLGRHLPLPASFGMRALSSERTDQDTHGRSRRCRLAGVAPLFTTRYGTPIEPRNFDRACAGPRGKAGVRATPSTMAAAAAARCSPTSTCILASRWTSSAMRGSH